MSDDENVFVTSVTENHDEEEENIFISPTLPRKAKKVSKASDVGKNNQEETRPKRKYNRRKDKVKQEEEEEQDIKRKRTNTSNTIKKKSQQADEDEKYKQYYGVNDYNDYPLYAETISGSMMKKVIEIITPLTPDAILRFSNEGLHIFGMEQVKMAILSAHFDTNLFHPYKCDKAFDIAVDTQHFSRILQHVPKYDSLTFFITDKNNPHILGILMRNFKKRTFHITKLIGNEMQGEQITIPAQEFGGFIIIPAVDFQNHIHELFQTATVVTLATNMKDFRMVAQGTANSGHISPRHLVFNPSVNGIRFTKKNPVITMKTKGSNLEDDDDDTFVHSDRVEVGRGKEEDEEPNQEIDEDDNDNTGMIQLSKVLEDSEKTMEDLKKEGYILATYMLKYLNAFTKATQLAEDVVILFQNDGPLIVYYKVEGGVLTFCLCDINSVENK